MQARWAAAAVAVPQRRVRQWQTPLLRLPVRWVRWAAVGCPPLASGRERTERL